MRFFGALLLVLLCSACASRYASGPHWAESTAGEDSRVAVCIEVFEAIERAVQGAGVRDAEARPVPGHPHLRVNRFLASFRKEELSDAARADWLNRMAELDRQGRYVELRNLPVRAAQDLRSQLAELTGRKSDPRLLANECRRTLVMHDLSTPSGSGDLHWAASVPDHYDRLQQVVGLYPLTSIGVAIGFDRWKDENLASFDLNWDDIPSSGTATAWLPAEPIEPLSREEAGALLRGAAVSPLGVPKVGWDDFRRLAEMHAPVLWVDTASEADRIGRPLPKAPGATRRPGVDNSDPASFVRLAYTRMNGKTLPQLVYSFWFDERPARGEFDLLSGRLDGLVWRVTLDLDGRPVVYDSIHPCGCYHLFFPVEPYERRDTEEDHDLREEALTPAAAPLLDHGERIVLRIQAGTHYLQAVESSGKIELPAERSRYRIVWNADIPDLDLRSIPTGDEERPFQSLYGETGVIAGTDRSERLFLWPMGIESAGAMRQWGTHATAFVGTRHFDDPFLMEKNFERAPSNAGESRQTSHKKTDTVLTPEMAIVW